MANVSPKDSLKATLSRTNDRTFIDLTRRSRNEYGMTCIPRDSMNWHVSVSTDISSIWKRVVRRGVDYIDIPVHTHGVIVMPPPKCHKLTCRAKIPSPIKTASGLLKMLIPSPPITPRMLPMLICRIACGLTAPDWVIIGVLASVV